MNKPIVTCAFIVHGDSDIRRFRFSLVDVIAQEMVDLCIQVIFYL